VSLIIGALGFVTAIAVAVIQYRGKKDDSVALLAERVKKLEDEEPAELAAKAIAEAKTATESAERVAGDLKKHVEDELARRERARDIGQRRDDALAGKLDALKGGSTPPEDAVDGDRRSLPFLDTLTGYDPDDDDPVMRALHDLDAALDERGRAIEELKKRSDPPPPLLGI
jgi:hypothetical protein